MIEIPSNLTDRRTVCIKQKGVPDAHHLYYSKQLRYYFDFGHRHRFHSFGRNAIPAFIAKSKKKRQAGLPKVALQNAHFDVTRSQRPGRIKRNLESSFWDTANGSRLET